MGNINLLALRNFSYGLFVLTAKDGDRNTGCIINTAQQVTDNPTRISIAVNKDNFTNEVISKTGVFNVSVISERATFDLFKRFGFSSGRDTDKLSGFDAARPSSNGLVYVTEGTNAFMSAAVEEAYDCGTHTIFIGVLTEAEVFSSDSPATYTYYFKNIKPAPENKKKGFVCTICGYIHEDETLPEDFVCPICKHGASVFEALK